MKMFSKYFLSFAILLFSAGILFGAIVINRETITLEQLQDFKALLPWTPDDIMAFQKNAESKEGSFNFDSYVVLDAPPKEKDADKAAKELDKFKAKYAKKGTVPFKVMVGLDLVQKKDNKKVRFTKGKSEIYLLSETDKKVSLKEKVNNAKLCPT